MFIRSLSPAERRFVWEESVLPDLHPITLKTFDYMEALHDRGILRVLGAFEAEALLGYAYLDAAPGLCVQLLDFFGVLPAYRDRGIGTRFLTLLTEMERFGPVPVAEVEDPDAAEGAEQALDARRIAFYERAGWHDTGVRADVTHYRCRLLAPTETLSEGLLRRDMLALYKAVVGEGYTAENILLH